jgi:hypothetical protein
MKPSVGAIHEAAVLFGGSPRIKNRQDSGGFIGGVPPPIKNRQDIAPTDGLGATPKISLCVYI